jgi:hypothetical protein
MLLDPKAPANVALEQVFAGVDKLKRMGFKKKGILKMVSIHLKRRQSKHTAKYSVDTIRHGLAALAGK